MLFLKGIIISLVLVRLYPLTDADCSIKCGVVETTRGDTSLLSFIQRVWTDVQRTRGLMNMSVTFKGLERRTDMDWDTFVQAYMDIGNKNVSCIFGPYAQPVVASSERYGIPYFVMDTSPQQPYVPYNLLKVFPDPSEIHKIAVEITKRYGISDVAVFYQGSYGSELIEELVQLPTLRIRAYKLDYGTTDAELKEIMFSTRQLVVTNYIVMASRTITNRILQQALHLSMLSRRYIWILSTLNQEEADIKPYVYTQVNLTTFRMTQGDLIVNARTQSPFTEFEYTTLYDSLLTLHESIKLYYRSFSNCFWTGKDHLLQTLHQVNVEGATGVLSYREDGSRQGYTVNLLGIQSEQLTKIGQWNSSQEQQTRLQLNFDAVASGQLALEYPLGQRVVKVVTMLEDPFVMLVSGHERKSGNAKYEGYCVDLIEHIAADLGFDYELYVSPDNQFGSKNESDGSWNGMIRELLAGNASLSVASMTITAHREEVIDFSKPFRPRGLTIMMKKPQKHQSFFQLLDPLSPVVWALIGAVLVVISLILYIVERLAPLSNNSEHSSTVTECFWFTFASLLRNGVDYVPRSVPGKIMAGFLWFFSLIIVSTYTANLAAFLTISKFVTPINSVFDLGNQVKVQYGTVRESASSDFFKYNKLDYFQQVWEIMSAVHQSSMVNSHIEGIEKVRNSNGDYAFIWDADVIRHEVNLDCDLVEVGQVFDNAKGYGIGTPRGVAYRDDISMAILRLSENGVLFNLDQKWWEQSTCPDAVKRKATGKREALSIDSIFGVFIVLAAGVIISLFTAFITYYISKKRPHRNEHKQDNNVANEFVKNERNNSHNLSDRKQYDKNAMPVSQMEPFLSNSTFNPPSCSKQTNIF